MIGLAGYGSISITDVILQSRAESVSIAMPKSAEPMISIRLPKEWIDQLNLRADELGSTRSDLIREALREVYGFKYSYEKKETA